MGSWSEQQEVKKEVKEKEKTSRETLGKFFYDLAKISFTALVVGSVVSFEEVADYIRNSKKGSTLAMYHTAVIENYPDWN